ncbi:hypothetical protein Esi_0000_0107 [Ectocarpus siliculosus]|uniref:Uncharacterized protein n=1 Tax=Ectocarpus siliculosus TaxID=2880 RepID=D8LAZ0_ECTSI|nr:hypothetical protein Esi_0000_0107 [Ectocarpus siliculosus]|eukprot:CBN76499.1 hypothetical protein Esi_0000_0107 [Ectocarpus siliculosus]
MRSSRFLKTVDPRNPPKLFVNKYEDPIRTDVLVLDEEANWIVTYQPSGGRYEVVQHMYLRFREGAVYGVGFEEGRKACKISGKYKRNEGANQVAVVMTCRSSPGLRNMGATKYKASFLMLKMEGIGDTHIRARLHTSRVQKWAGNLYPDDAIPLPASNKRSSGGARRGEETSPGAEPFVSDDDLGGIGRPRATSSSTRRALSRRRQGSDSVASGRGGDGSGGMSMKKVLGYLPSFGRRRSRSSVPPGPTPPASAHSTTSTNELPPWVLTGGETGSARGGGSGGGGRTDSSSSGNGYTYSIAPSSAPGPPRPSSDADHAC